MQETLKKLVCKTLREIADKIDGGNCELSETEASEILSTITHTSLSKEEACDFLNLRRSRFDELVRLGKIPKGRKLRGRKELIWFKDDLTAVIKGCK